MRNPSRGACVIALLVVLGAPSLVRARPKKAAPAARPAASPDKAEAAKLLDEGNQAFARGEQQRALDLFLAAYERYPSPKILLNVAEAHYALKQLGAAADAYDRFLGAATELPPDRVARARERLAELQGKVGQLHVDGLPEESRLEIDGRPVPPDRARTRVFVDVGTHEVHARNDGEGSVHKSVVAVAGKLVVVEMRPPPPPPKPAPPTPREPEARPVVAAPAPPPARPRSVFRSPLVLAGIGLTTATALALVGTGSAALVFHDRYEDPTRAAAAREDARRTGDRFAWASEGLLIGTVAFAVATTTCAIVLHMRARRR